MANKQKSKREDDDGLPRFFFVVVFFVVFIGIYALWHLALAEAFAGGGGGSEPQQQTVQSVFDDHPHEWWMEPEVIASLGGALVFVFGGYVVWRLKRSHKRRDGDSGADSN